MQTILIGLDKDDNRVEIPVHHTGVFGITGVGKTKLLKYMIAQANQQEEYRILIFDSKITKAEFEGIGAVLPFYLEESTDPDVFLSLLEGMRSTGRGSYHNYRPGFIKICEGTKDFHEIGVRLKAKLDDTKTIKGSTRGMYEEIQYDYRKLMDLLGNFEFTTNLERAMDNTHSAIMRMVVRDLPNRALQGLVIRSVVENLLKWAHHLIVVVDEAPNFVHQKRYNPAKNGLQLLDSQGRSSDIFGWYSGQTLTGFDKDNMKNLWYWILGREMENNEAKDVLETLTTKIVTKEEIKKLPERTFLVSTPEFTNLVKVPTVDEELFGPITYIVPPGKSARVRFTVRKVDEVDVETANRLENDNKRLTTEVEELRKTLKVTTDTLRDTEAQRKATKAMLEMKEKDLAEVQKQFEGVKRVRDALRELLPEIHVTSSPSTTKDTPSAINVTSEQPTLNITVTRKPLDLTDKDLAGKITVLYAERKLKEENWITSRDISTLLENRGWGAMPSPQILSVMDQFCAWGYFEKHLAGKRPEYRMMITPAEAEKKGLLKREEVVA